MRNRQYDMQQYRINEPTEVTGGLQKNSRHLVSRRLCIGCGELVVCFFVGQQKCAIPLAPLLWPILSFASADHCDSNECITTSPELTLVEWINEWMNNVLASGAPLSVTRWALEYVWWHTDTYPGQYFWSAIGLVISIVFLSSWLETFELNICLHYAYTGIQSKKEF